MTAKAPKDHSLGASMFYIFHCLFIEILGCTRQNIDDLVKRQKIKRPKSL
ncbi:hypothetical protein DHBDCA_p927 [Dehalobacter sp. DCA]|nr:hypothetical protein DHBDCA_p927 [Dehalobacter sp. DCA]AFV04990.1 hypothetical protein DCF50_p985 [Dehalobacter sp. CF]